MIKQRDTVSYLPENESPNVKDDMLVSITLYRVPSSLVREFVQRIVVNYPGGISGAIQELMRKSIEE